MLILYSEICQQKKKPEKGKHPKCDKKGYFVLIKGTINQEDITGNLMH